MSRVSKEQALKNRAAIVSAAARLFREHGLDGVSVADIAAAVGLTHGGFYSHFSSKEELAAAAILQAIEETFARWSEQIDKSDDQCAELGNLLERYLGPRHRDATANSCVVASLCGDAARTSPDSPVRAAFIEAVEYLLNILMKADHTPEQSSRLEDALVDLSTMVGALMLSRATKGSSLSSKFLSAARRAVTQSAQSAHAG
jgi:TetR/AcrR family transcriptional repressor of nem operon